MNADGIPIRDPLDVFIARWAVKRIAETAGFTTASCEELAIVVSELATNILKYGVRGQITMRRLDGSDIAIEVVAEDEGPPMVDFALAVRDNGPLDASGQVRRGGLGAGLAAIARMTDIFEYLGARKAFRAVRYRRRRPLSSP